MRVVLLSANLGGFEQPTDHAPQVMPVGVELAVVRITDREFPPRLHTMLPRMQMGLVKRFAWEWVPGADVVIWIDSSVTLFREDSVQWFLDTLGEADFALLPHPHRHSIRAEYDFVKAKLAAGCSYLTPRYENERLEEQMRVIAADAAFVDDKLYASTAFAFRDNVRTRAACKEWFVHVAKYHALDQLSLPYVVWQAGCTVHPLSGNLYRHPHLTYTRKSQ
jgi:hypothetical protein